MDINTVVQDAASQVLGMFGMSAQFKQCVEEKNLSSADEVNILIGLTNGIKGNIVVSMDKPLSLRLASAMMGGVSLSTLDEISKSALCELSSMFVGVTIQKMQDKVIVEPSPPTLINGKDMFLMISRVASKKVQFDLSPGTLNVSVAIE